MAIIKLKPAEKEAVWGGRKLIEEFGFSHEGDNLAEAWVLSAHPDGSSTIANGEHEGEAFADYIAANGEKVLGKNGGKYGDFPILIKFIDAKSDLSVQVHPDEEYAKKHENQHGKTEMWYVIDAEPGATLCYGCKKSVTREEFRENIDNTTLDRVMNMVPVKKGDVFFIEAGTLHAIGAGVLVAEIQQNSNVTYRVYDYGRKGVDGKPRDLHIDKAVDVTNLNPPKELDFGEHIGACEAFVTDLHELKGDSYSGVVNDDSFVSLLIIDGNGNISCGDENLSAKKGDCFFLPAGSGEYGVEGDMTVIEVRIP